MGMLLFNFLKLNRLESLLKEEQQGHVKLHKMNRGVEDGFENVGKSEAKSRLYSTLKSSVVEDLSTKAERMFGGRYFEDRIVSSWGLIFVGISNIVVFW